MRYLMLLVLLTGCAFKGKEDQQVAAVASSQALGRSLTISWDGENAASVKRAVQGSRNYYLNEPVTIPDVAPDKIRIQFNSPILSGGKILQEPKVYISDVTDGRGVSNPMRLRGAMTDPELEIFGLRTFFAVDKQQRGLLRIAFQNAVTGEQEASLTLTLISPPITSEFVINGRNFVQEAALRKFQSHEMRLDLLYAFTVRNTAGQRQEYIIPNELKGALKKDFRRYNVVEHHCNSDIWQDSWTEDYPTRFFMLPLDESLEEDWIVRISETERSFHLDPGQEMLLGIYGSGTHLASFVDNGVPTSTHTTRSTVVGCYDPCATVAARDPELPPKDPICKPRQIKEYREVPVGIDTGGVRWALDGESIRMRVRNGFLPRVDDPISRVFLYLPAELGIL